MPKGPLRLVWNWTQRKRISFLWLDILRTCIRVPSSVYSLSSQLTPSGSSGPGVRRGSSYQRIFNMELWLGPPSLHLCPFQRQPTWAQVSPLRREERRSQFGIYKSQIIYLSSVHPLEAEQVQVFAFPCPQQEAGSLGISPPG